MNVSYFWNSSLHYFRIRKQMCSTLGHRKTLFAASLGLYATRMD
uniref:Uncharacterized protein n=1 Tax=Rhizophora mucronata TaxID=61149 RepID=A0A2P2PQ56_RHIMU